MKIKTFIILIIIAVVLSAGGYLLTRLQTGRSSESMMGRSLFKGFPAEKISTITIQGPKESVHLKKLEKRWVVQSRMNYPADFQKISDLVRKLNEAKIGRVFESNPGSLQRLALIDPAKETDSSQESGLRVVFKDEKGEEIKSLLLGKPRDTGDPRGPVVGQYLMLQGDSKIYLVDSAFPALEPVSLEWLETELTDVPASDIKGIVCEGPDKKKIRYHFERSAQGKDFEAIQFPTGKKVKKSALNQLAAALASFNMENIADGSALQESPVKMSNLIEYRLFNGLVYRIRPADTCSEDGKCYLKIEVAYQKPPALAVGKDKVREEMEKQEKSGAQAQEDLSQEAVKLNNQFEPWTYIIPSWKKDVFITDVSRLVEETTDHKKNK